MPVFGKRDKRSILFITLDSCRYDSFEGTNLPNMKSIGRLWRAMAPAYFTYASHMAMFVGFTPGIATIAEPHVNPKFAKIFKLVDSGFPGKGHEFMTLEGANIIDALKKRGYYTVGSGSARWFDPDTETGAVLGRDFQKFLYAGNTWSLRRQLQWIEECISSIDDPVFVFLNVGETHVPYYHEGAAWSPEYCPCIPFATTNDANECRRRQTACLKFVDENIKPLLDAFRGSTTLLCSDHGDCWGEDGIWEHGVFHQKIVEVPLLYRLAKP